ncbi:MAG: DUF4105 domain-containing protein [Sphaerochaetaceae bacterium]|nr:DUF4105 domain-containing protein [Sphaerochaetaceae bacterium]
MNRKVIAILMLILICIPLAWAASLRTDDGAQSYDSEVMLGNWDFNPVLKDASIMDGYEIYLVTITKGDQVFTWFGHTGLMVQYPNGSRINFDYGLFSYNDDFYKNFAMGRLWYSVCACYEEDEIEQYDSENRSMRYVKLDLTPEQKYAVINYLAYNVKPENSHYMYHYYLDNCATRIRDILDYASGGEFRKWSESQASTSFRKEAARALEVDSFWDYLLNFLQSGQIDKPITRWDAMFLPDELEKAVIEFGMGEETGMLLDNTASDPRPATLEKYSFWREILIPGIIMVLVCALFAFLSVKGKRKAYGIAGFIVYLVLGLLSSLLFFMCIFTNHSVTWFNENLIFANPLLLVFAVSNIVFATKKTMRAEVLKKQDRFMFFLAFALVVLKVALPGVFSQNNALALISIMPVYAVRAFVPFRKADPESKSSAKRKPVEYSQMI